MQLADSIRKARQVKNKLSHPSCAAVIVAAGSSARMGGTDKLLAELGGLPVLSRTLRVFDDHEMIDTIIVVAREDRMPKISRVCSPYRKVRIVVPGGESRQESVMHGLKAVPEGTELVAVHDGARPLVPPEVITKAILKAAKIRSRYPKPARWMKRRTGPRSLPCRRRRCLTMRCCWARCRTQSRRGFH